MPGADVTIVKTGSGTVNRGSLVYYTLTAKNIGSVAVQNVSVTDPIPSGLTYNDLLSDTRCNMSGNTVVYCFVGSMTAGQQTLIKVVFQTYVTTACGNFTNVATIKTTTPEVNYANNQATFQTNVLCASSVSSSYRFSSSAPPPAPPPPAPPPFIPLPPPPPPFYSSSYSSVPLEYCGDGIQQPREMCEPVIIAANGSRSYNPDCSATCQILKYPFCGDGKLDKGEECDDGNTRDGDGCTALCKFEAKVCAKGECKESYCGDGIVQSALGEQCDDGNRVSNDDCDNACKWVKLPECGDGILQPEFEQCDKGSANGDYPGTACRFNCVLPYCGDDTQDINEECDDGNNLNGDACSAVCMFENRAAPPPVASIIQPYNPPPITSSQPAYYGNIPTPAKTPTGPGLVIFLASGAAAGIGLVRRRLPGKK